MESACALLRMDKGPIGTAIETYRCGRDAFCIRERGRFLFVDVDPEARPVVGIEVAPSSTACPGNTSSSSGRNRKTSRDPASSHSGLRPFLVSLSQAPLRELFVRMPGQGVFVQVDPQPRPGW